MGVRDSLYALQLIGGVRIFSYPRLLNKYIIFFKNKLLTHVHEFLKLTIKF
jgi:hypothetical protein